MQWERREGLRRAQRYDALTLLTCADESGPRFVIQTTKYRPCASRRSNVVWPVTDWRSETGWNGPLALSPASISAVKPGVFVVTVTWCTVTDRPASSTSPTPR